jgi:hypothetical protein
MALSYCLRSPQGELLSEAYLTGLQGILCAWKFSICLIRATQEHVIKAKDGIILPANI